MAKKAIVMGATSGIGMEVAKLLAAKGWQVGIAGRRIERLQALISQSGITCYQQIDVTSPDAPAQFLELILHVVVDGFRLILDRYAGQIGALSFRNPDFFEGFLDFVRHIFPSSGYFIGCLLEISDFVEFQMG